MADTELARRLGELLGEPVRELSSVHGGDICEAYRLDTPSGPRFAKVLPADRAAPASFFATEAAGLAWLSDAGAVAVPRVLAVGSDALVLEWIDTADSAAHGSGSSSGRSSGRGSARDDEAFGAVLASLHDAGAEAFGTPPPGVGAEGWIGTVAVTNTAYDTWPEFFWQARVEPLVRTADRSGALPDGAVRLAERLPDHLAELAGPPEPPARVHGDLWWGNVVWAAGGTAWLVDPSAHGDHRETDLAMLALFGGISGAFLAGYESVHPLADGWQGRQALHQLVPLLVHAILFGGSYGTQAHAILRRYLA